MNSIPEKFKPIFWGTSFEELDTEKNKLYIISHMYYFGLEQSQKILRSTEERYDQLRIFRNAAIKNRSSK